MPFTIYLKYMFNSVKYSVAQQYWIVLVPTAEAAFMK